MVRQGGVEEEKGEATAEVERDCVSPEGKRKKRSRDLERNGRPMPVLSQVVIPLNGSPVGNGRGLHLPIITSRDSDSDSGDDPDLPDVSMSFGTPSREGPLSCESYSNIYSRGHH